VTTCEDGDCKAGGKVFRNQSPPQLTGAFGSNTSDDIPGVGTPGWRKTRRGGAWASYAGIRLQGVRHFFILLLRLSVLYCDPASNVATINTESQ
jgi:hypothetical protein